ncbi:MAG: GAF domain-containing sensor histidine kinase [Clostridiales bacterium]|nr:GAF domain-containing sensor histidine kinase [Clostridiales bacterium]
MGEDGTRGALSNAVRPLAARVRGLIEALPFCPERRVRNNQLLEALNDVASAVSSRLSVEDILDTVVDRAKLLSGTDKTAIVLAAEREGSLDYETLTVRGRRDTHPEEWWIERVRQVAPVVLAEGNPRLEPIHEHNGWLLCLPLRIREQGIGLLCAINDVNSPFVDHQIESLRIVASFAAAAVENARLSEEHRNVLLASERDRIAREMHDGISQSLFSISLGLEVCRKQVLRDPKVVAARLEELQDELTVSMAELRRVIYDLRPAKLAELGLAASIEQWIKEATAGRPLTGSLVVRGDSRLVSGATEACLYRVAKEAISNVVRHSGASSFEALLDYHAHSVILLVADNGNGFDLKEARAAAAHRRGSLGLYSIGYRVRAEGGTVRVRSVPGEGTQVRVEIPL